MYDIYLLGIAGGCGLGIDGVDIWGAEVGEISQRALRTPRTRHGGVVDEVLALASTNECMYAIRTRVKKVFVMVSITYLSLCLS